MNKRLEDEMETGVVHREGGLGFTGTPTYLQFLWLYGYTHELINYRRILINCRLLGFQEGFGAPLGEFKAKPTFKTLIDQFRFQSP